MRHFEMEKFLYTSVELSKDKVGFGVILAGPTTFLEEMETIIKAKLRKAAARTFPIDCLFVS